MLSDSARKLLRILWSLGRHEPARLDFPALCRMSQRKRGVVMVALAELERAGYIEWERAAEVAKVLQAHEMDPNVWRYKYR